MEQEILENQARIETPQVSLEAVSKRVDEIYISVEKTRRYFLWTLIITIVTIVLPLIGLAIVIPYFMKTLTSGLGI